MKYGWTPWITRPRLLTPGSSTFGSSRFHAGFVTVYRKDLKGTLESRTFKSLSRGKSWGSGDNVPEMAEDIPQAQRFTKAESEHYIKHGTTDLENYPDDLRV